MNCAEKLLEPIKLSSFVANCAFFWSEANFSISANKVKINSRLCVSLFMHI